jgi:hypothetical protein
MRFSILVLTVFLLGRSARADDVDAKIQELAQKLAKEGASLKLSELIGTPQGLQAVKEKIDFLISWRTGRIERDSQGRFEDFMFELKPDGSLELRSDREDALGRLKRAVERAPRIREAFDRRLDALVARISDTLEVDKKMKAGLAEPEVRLALFHKYLGDARESDLEELLDWTLTQGLTWKADQRLAVGGPHAQDTLDRLKSTTDQLESIRNFEAVYLKEVVKVEDAALRTLASGEAAVIFVVGRIIREGDEGTEDRTGSLTDPDPANNVERAITLNKDLPAIFGRFSAFSKTAEDLKPLFEKIGSALSEDGDGEKELAKFLKNDRARFLLAERILALRDGQAAKADKVFAQLQEDWFVAAGDRLMVKPGRFVDEQKADTPEAVWNELQNGINDFNGGRTGLEQIAERLNDPSLISLFKNREATFAVNDQIQDLVDRLTEVVRRDAFSDFVKLYLAPEGDGFKVRPERAGRIDDMEKRAEELRKEAEKAGK